MSTTNSPSREGGWKNWEEELRLLMTDADQHDKEKAIWLVKHLLSSQRDTLVEGLRKMKWDDDGQVANYDERNRVAFYTHNSAIDATIKLIKEMR